jgi:hypothetical protein
MLAAPAAAAAAGGGRVSDVGSEADAAAAAVAAAAAAKDLAAAAAAAAGIAAGDEKASSSSSSSVMASSIVLPRVSSAMTDLEPPCNWSQLVSLNHVTFVTFVVLGKIRTRISHSRSLQLCCKAGNSHVHAACSVMDRRSRATRGFGAVVQCM